LKGDAAPLATGLTRAGMRVGLSGPVERLPLRTYRPIRFAPNLLAYPHVGRRPGRTPGALSISPESVAARTPATSAQPAGPSRTRPFQPGASALAGRGPGRRL